MDASEPTVNSMQHNNVQNPLDMFPRNFTVDGKLPTCCGLFSDTANYLDTSRQFAVSLTSPQQVRNKSLWRNLENDTTQQTQRIFARANFLRTCDGLTDVLRRSYVATGVINFGLKTQTGVI